MTFDSLINKKMPEVQIFDYAVEILQRNFSAYQDVNVCLMLDVADGEICSVIEVRYYKTHDEKDTAARFEFFHKCEYQKVYLNTQFKNGFYHLDLFGHYISKFGDVYLNEVNDIRIIKRTEDRSTQKQLPYELVMGAFKEFKTELLELKKKSS